MDLDTGAVVAVTVQAADRGDTTTVYETAGEAMENVAEDAFREVVADKGYHSNETVRAFADIDVRTYVSEPLRRGRRRWKGRDAERRAVYGNRRRIRGERGKRLLAKRGELLERSFAHCYETGAMRRTHLRGHANLLKRLLVHVAGFNLSLVMRALLGAGTPRALAGLPAATLRSLAAGLNAIARSLIRAYQHRAPSGSAPRRLRPSRPRPVAA